MAAWLLKMMGPVAHALAQQVEHRFAHVHAAVDLATITQEQVRGALDAVDMRAIAEREIMAGVERCRAAKSACGEVRRPPARMPGMRVCVHVRVRACEDAIVRL